MGILSSIWSRLRGEKQSDKPKNIIPIGWFGNSFLTEADAEANATYMSAVNTHARHISKIVPSLMQEVDDNTFKTVKNKKYLKYILQFKPNPIMNSPTLWKIVATDYFYGNLAICWLEWDYTNIYSPLKAIWPLNIDSNMVQVYKSKSSDQLIVSFTLNGHQYYVYEEDLLILRREVDLNNLFEGKSKAIEQTLKTIDASYSGLEHAIKQSQFIRFIVKSATNISNDMITKRQKEYAERFYNGDGLIYIGGGDDLTEVNSNGKWPLAPELENLKNDIYEYQGITSDIIKGNFKEEQFQSYFEGTLEPFCRELSIELTTKILTKPDIDRGYQIIIKTSPLQTASLQTRIKIAEAMMGLPMVVPNNVLTLLYQAEIEGGEVPQASLNFVKGKEQTKYQIGEDTEKPKNKEEKK